MTPLAKLLARVMPAPLVGPSLSVIYAAAMATTLLAAGSGQVDIIYVDVQAR
ncbi:MAG TPA: hypothetical protein VLM36_10275 [Sphingomicrobium sp.]|nr:hypothetical protein [Sphingomicrobium sp.]